LSLSLILEISTVILIGSDETGNDASIFGLEMKNTKHSNSSGFFKVYGFSKLILDFTAFEDLLKDSVVFDRSINEGDTLFFETKFVYSRKSFAMKK
jgi:hypothetical protein